MEEEPNPRTEKEKWIEEIDDMHIESAVMNRLVMDYLVMEGFKEVSFHFFVSSFKCVLVRLYDSRLLNLNSSSTNKLTTYLILDQVLSLLMELVDFRLSLSLACLTISFHHMHLLSKKLPNHN